MILYLCLTTLFLAGAFLSLYYYSAISLKSKINHLYVEPLKVALPQLTEEIGQLVQTISDIAQVRSPSGIFIFRSEKENAFVYNFFGKTRLFISDELIEACNEDGSDKGVQKLEWVICHEIAHIVRHDSIRTLPFKTVLFVANYLGLSKLKDFALNKLNKIEIEADELANRLFQKSILP